MSRMTLPKIGDIISLHAEIAKLNLLDGSFYILKDSLYLVIDICSNSEFHDYEDHAKFVRVSSLEGMIFFVYRAEMGSFFRVVNVL